jgi:hypothetical protein
MKNITNTLTKLLAVVIFSVSLNAFSLLPLAPVITISTSYVSATAGTFCTAPKRSMESTMIASF